MIRRCIWKLSSGQLLGRRHRTVVSQSPLFLSWGHEFSSSSLKNSIQKPSPAEEISGSTDSTSKVILGSAILGAAVMAAYQTGYIKLHVNDDSSLRTSNMDNGNVNMHPKHSVDVEILQSNESTSQVKPNAGSLETNESNNVDKLKINTEISETNPIQKEPVPSKEDELSVPTVNGTTPLDEKTVSSEALPEEILSEDSSLTYVKPNQDESRKSEGSVAEKEDLKDRSLYHSKKADIKVSDSYQDIPTQVQKGTQDSESSEGKSLAESNSLPIDDETSKDYRKTEDTDAIAMLFKDEETFTRSSKDKEKPADLTLVLDFIEAIHAAERRQAESDAHIFTEEKRKMKEKFEKELKDARARELMYAEEAAILEKEVNKERAKAAASIKSIQEQAEQKLREELQLKEEEADVQLKKAEGLAKAELAAAIANEKSSQIEKIAEANLNINALCMAFYARSEEARQTHSVHRLALGTLALEDALSKGLPIRTEVDALYKSLEGIDRESLLGLALSSLPADTINHGIVTPLQLNQKFDCLKGALRHFSLIPAGGGGLLAHVVAHIASSIKMREDGSSDSIESLISKVESFLAENKYAEAADILEEGVRGTEAEVVTFDWLRQARNRAVAEQALSLLQSYALSITFE